jgi:hypothetical protein
MTSRKNCLSLIGGVAAFLLVLTPNAFAKHSSTGGQAQVPCGDGTITYSPVTLWPPNHKMETINISFAESEATSDSDTLALQVTGISSNQDAADAAGGSGCGKDKAPGDDWTFSNAVVTGTAGDDVHAVPTSVQVAAERCAKIKSARVYTIDVTCTDDGGTDSVPLTVTVAHDHGKKH